MLDHKKSFYKNKLKTIRENNFDIKDNDNYITINETREDSKTTLIFNISNKIHKEKPNYSYIYAEVGIKNKYFCAKVSDYLFSVTEFKKFYNRLCKDKLLSDEYEEYTFVNSTLKFLFWSMNDKDMLDISFHFNTGNDTYTISLNNNEKNKLYALINNQIKKLER